MTGATSRIVAPSPATDSTPLWKAL